MIARFVSWILLLSAFLFLSTLTVFAQTNLLNVSRELQKEINPLIGPWAEVGKTHFGDGGIHDQITVK